MHFVLNSPLISLLLHLRGQVVKKERDNINFLKSQPLFGVHRQYLWTFLIDLLAEVSRFGCQICHCSAYFSKFSSILIGFVLYKLSAGDCLAFKAI